MKKFLSMALALAMTLSLVVVGASATEYKDLKDKDQIKHSEAVSVMNKIGVISGYTDGTFKPTASITRGAAAKIVCYAKLGATVAGSLSSEGAPFKDVSAKNVFAPYIAYCTNMKIVNGYLDKTFRPSTNLTGYAFAKMLLNALGITGTYTGNGWEINVATAAQNAGLFDGVDSTVVMSKALSRDNACQMALNAMNYSATTTNNYGVTVYTAVKALTAEENVATKLSDTTLFKANSYTTFATSSEAMSFFAVMNSQATGYGVAVAAAGKVVAVTYDGKTTTASDSLLKSVFNVSRSTSSADAFGQPNTTYSKSTWTSNMEFPATAVKTYTTSVTLGTLYTDLGLSAAKGYTKYVDGAKSDVTATGTQAIAKGSSVALENSGNGVLTEVYKDGSAYTIAQVNTYVGDVAAVTAKTASKDRSITIAKRGVGTSGTFTTDDFAIDDVVLYTYSNMPGSVGIQSVEKAKTVSGTVTAYNSSTGVTLDTTAYGYSAKVANKAAATKVAATVVLDKYGYAIDVSNATASTTYAYVVASGDTWSSTHQARLLFTDGSVKDVVTTGPAKATAGTICTYTANSDNTYTLGTPTAVTITDNAVGADTAIITTNNSNLGSIASGLIGTGSTVFLVASKNAAGTVVYNAYVGIKNVPTVTLKNTKKPVTDAKISAVAKDNLAKVVYVDATDSTVCTLSNSTTSSANSIFVYCPDYTKLSMTSDSVKGDYYTYNAVINGTITKLEVAAKADKTAPIIASGVYTGITYDANKIATLDVAVTTTGNGTVKAANNVIGLAGAYYGYASDCKVFTIDADGNLAASTIASIGTDATDTVFFTKNSSNDVNYIYVVPVNSNVATMSKISYVVNGAAAVDKVISASGDVTDVANTASGKTVTISSVTVAAGASYTVSGSATVAANGATIAAANQITITVTAENGTIATYTIGFQAAA